MSPKTSSLRETLEAAFVPVGPAGQAEVLGFNQSATEAELLDLPALFGEACGQIADLYKQHNGVFWQDPHGRRTQWIIWPIALAISSNEEEAQKGDEVDGYAFFGPAGQDGILFALSKAGELGVFAWYPDEGRIDRIADTLASFLENTVSGVVTF